MAIIDSITLKNFGVHRNRTFKFDKGFNVIRGANEAGKTTILEGIAICFFGNSALRGGWEDVVTTGEKVGSLSLNMRYGDLTIHRSKGSASVVSDDGKVQISGHTDVTNFFLTRFGIEKGTEKYIMLAKQGAIQGILDSGATDATQFIEQLAGFDQIDALVAKLKVKYPVIDAQALSQQISSLETKLADKQAEEVPDVTASRVTLADCTHRRNLAQDKVTRIGEIITKLGTRLEEAKEKKREFDATTTRVASQTVLVSDLKMNQTGIVGQVKILEVEIDCSKGRLEGAQKFLGGLAKQQSLYQTYRQVVDFASCEDTWDEDWQKLVLDKFKLGKEIEEKRALVTANNTLITRLESTSVTSEQLTKFEERRDKLKVELEVLKNLHGDGEEVLALRKKLDENETQIVITKAKLVTEGICPTCHTDLTHSHEDINDSINEELEFLQEKENKLANELVTALVVQKATRTMAEQELIKEQAAAIFKINEVIKALKEAQQTEINKLDAVNTTLLIENQEAIATVTAMEEIVTTQQAVENILNSAGEVEIEVDKTVYPWTMKWADDVPVEPTQQQISKANTDLVYCQGLVTQLKSKNEEYHKVCQQISGAEGLLAALQKELLTKVDTTEEINRFLAILETSKTQQLALNEDLTIKIAMVTTATTELALAEQAVKNRDAAIVEINTEMQAVLKQIQASAENNALHRAVAEGRIKVIEGVWNTLLTAANDCFSAIRGVPSEITREGKSFKVNGLKTIRLSGSTLDSLGLAMRAAIRDVFAPNTEFMFLDEAAAGADSERTAAMMAQIASLNVEQTILVTHEEVSDTLANHIIEV